VLGHITDEDHVGRGPRNTAERLAQELDEDPFTDFAEDTAAMQELLDDLEASGLVSQDDGVYTVTDAGHAELAN
jgi:DNA-binding PadR family transcriptional regulator